MSKIDLGAGGDAWQDVLEQLKAEAGQSLQIGMTLRSLAEVELC